MHSLRSLLLKEAMQILYFRTVAFTQLHTQSSIQLPSLTHAFGHAPCIHQDLPLHFEAQAILGGLVHLPSGDLG